MNATKILSNWLLGALLLLLFAGVPHPAVGETDPPPSPEFRDPDATAEQQRTVTIALYLLVAVTVGLVSLLIVLMLWGARVRRQARKPLPTITPNDPLWYLKTKKHSPSEPDRPPNVSEEKDQTQDRPDESSSGE